MILRDGPKYPPYPHALIHPLGPLFRHLPLSLRRHLLYLRAYRRWGNFQVPQLWSEKMAWRVLHDERTILKVGADKLASKEYMRALAASSGGTIPLQIPETYWVGTSINDLRQHEAELPARWVLKPNHTCGRFALIDSELAPIDWEQLERETARWLLPDEEITVMGHRAYRGARPLLFVEQRVGSTAASPNDLRVFGFSSQNGKPNVWEIQMSTGSHSAKFTNYRFTEEYVRKERYHFRDGRVEDRTLIETSSHELRAAILEFGSHAIEPFDHVRVDFYLDQGNLWFGELAVYPGAGLVTFPIEIDRERGALWQLPDLTVPDPRESEWRALLEETAKGTLQR
jgi:hypothetical protein